MLSIQYQSIARAVKVAVLQSVQLNFGKYRSNGEVCSSENQDFKDDDALWNLLLKHQNHSVAIVTYGDPDAPADVCLECENCGEVILDAEIYTLAARG